MCCTIKYKDKEIETVGEFVENINSNVVIDRNHRTIDYNSCLCQIDIKETLLMNKIKYIFLGYDYEINDD